MKSESAGRHPWRCPVAGTRTEQSIAQEYTQVIIKGADRLQGPDAAPADAAPDDAADDGEYPRDPGRVRSLLTAGFRDRCKSASRLRHQPAGLVGDREQLIQAVLNIARNAAQGNERRGEIILRTRAAAPGDAGQKRYRVAMEINGGRQRPGIPESIRERMFYPLVSGAMGAAGWG